MEDKVAIIENLDIFFYSKATTTTTKSHDINDSTRASSSLFAIFDGHCGLEASHYVSVHLPLHLIQHDSFRDAFYEQTLDSSSTQNQLLNELIGECFDTINMKFTKKAQIEVNESLNFIIDSI